MIEVVYFNNEASAKSAVRSFFKKYGFFSLYPYLENKLMHSSEACDPNIIVVCSDTSLQDNINKALDKMQGHQIRILVIVCPQENSTTYPAFKMNSKIKFWTHLICSHDDFESVPCIENELAKTVFDCFLDLVRMKLMSGSRVTGKSEPSNDISAIAEDRVQGPVFQEYIENVLGVPLHWIDRNSQMVPDLAICLNTDNIERSVQLLQDKSAEDTILVIINHCEEGVPIKRSTIFNSRFSSVIDLRFSECFNKFYGNDTSIEELKKLLSGNKGFEIAEDTCNMVRKQKQQGQTIFSSSMDAKKESGVEEWTLVDRDNSEDERRRKCQTVSFPMHKQTWSPHYSPKQTTKRSKSMCLSAKKSGKPILHFLCNSRKSECKKIICMFKEVYSLQYDFIWKTSANEVDLQEKVFLVCLKVSRLEDDIAHTISSVCLSDAVKPILIILHYCVKGVSLDVSLPTKDSRFKEIINILYSDESGCYECHENGIASKKMKKWAI